MSNAHRNQGPSAWRIHHVVKIPIPIAVSSTHQHLHQHQQLDASASASASASTSTSSPTPPIAMTTTMGVLMIATSSRETDDHVTDGTSDYLLVLQVMTGACRNNNDGLFRAILTEVDIRQAYKGKATTFAATTSVTSKNDQENKMLPPLFQQVVSWLLLSSLDSSSPSSATATQLASTHHPPDLSPAMQAQWTWIDNNTNNTDMDIESEEAPIGRSLHLQVMERLQNGIVLKPWSVTLLSSQHSSNNSSWDSFWLPLVDYQHCLLQQLQQQKHEAQLWLQARDEWQNTALLLQGAWEDEKSILIRNFLTLYQTQQTVCQKLHQHVRELQAELQHHGQTQLEQKQHEKRRARRRNVQDNDDKDHDDHHGNIWNNLPKDNEQDELFDAETVARLAAGQKLHPLVGGGQLPQSTLIHSPAISITKTTTGDGRRQIRNGGGDRSQSSNQSNDKNGTKEQVHTFLKQEEDEDEQQQQQKRQQHLNESADPNKSNPSTNPSRRIDEQPYHNATSKHVMWANDGNKSEMDHGRESKTSTIRNDSANSDLENNMALPDKTMTEAAKKKLSLAWDGTLDGDDDDDDLFDWKRSPKTNLVSAASDTTIHHSRNSASQSLILEAPATKNKPTSTATNQMPTTDRTSSIMSDIEKSAPRPSLRQFLEVDDDNDDDLEFIKHRRAPIVAELPLQTTQPLRHAEGGSNVGTANKKTATRKQWSMDDDDDAINNKNNNVTNNVTSAGTTVANVRQLPAKRSFLDSDTDDDDDSNLLIPKRKKRPQE